MPDNRHDKTSMSSPEMFESQRRVDLLRNIEERVKQNGVHIACPHPDRARQFMPFAALKGYHELAEAQEEDICSEK